MQKAASESFDLQSSADFGKKNRLPKRFAVREPVYFYVQCFTTQADKADGELSTHIRWESMLLLFYCSQRNGLIR